jgi:hypothetical protein
LEYTVLDSIEKLLFYQDLVREETQQKTGSIVMKLFSSPMLEQNKQKIVFLEESVACSINIL